MGWLTAPLGFYPEDPGYTGTFVVNLLHASLTDVNGRCTVIVCTKATLRTDIFMPVPVLMLLSEQLSYLFIINIRESTLCIYFIWGLII